jgi:putative transposase
VAGRKTVAGKDERALEVGLFRYALIREAADLSLSGRERGVLVRVLAAREHVGPDGRPVIVGRSTLDDWIRAYCGVSEFAIERPTFSTTR